MYGQGASSSATARPPLYYPAPNQPPAQLSQYPVPYGAPSPSGGSYASPRAPAPPRPTAAAQIGPPPSAANTSSVTTCALKIKDDLRLTSAPPPVQLHPIGERPASIDMSLEREICSQIDEPDAMQTSGSLLAGIGPPDVQRRPIHVPCVDSLDAKLQAVSAGTAAAADGDESLLRLALAACSERDDAGLLRFCDNMRQALDVAGGRVERAEVGMKLVAGQSLSDIVHACSF